MKSSNRQPAAAATPAIHKSLYLDWRRCPKLAWHRFNAPELLAPADAVSQALMKQGHEVNRLAWELFPGGNLVKDTNNVLQDAQRTAALLSQRLPLYEATFIAGPAAIRADILVPVGNGVWDLVEVKSTTKVEAEHLYDVGFQASILRAVSFSLRRCHLAHISSSYVRKGTIDVKQLFIVEDVTSKIEPLVSQIASDLPQIDRSLRQRHSPKVPVGPHCESPQRCPLYDACWGRMPEENVFTLYRSGRQAVALFEAGITDIAKIPTATRLTVRQQVQRKAVLSGRPHCDARAVRRFLKRLKYPLALLDFETFATAIPLFEGLRPYQQVPFQFSCHIVAEPGAEPEACGFLIKHRRDPRREFMVELRRQLPERGSVVVYNAAFEEGRMEECAAFLLEFRSWVRKVEARVVDLLEPFREFYYYHPAQHGSASIKAVLPALTGRSYDGLEIREGATAALRFLEVTFGKATTAQRATVWADLEKYCGQDTLAMLWVIEALERMTAGHGAAGPR